VNGAGPARTRLQASAVRGLTRFVGRRAELGHLRQALERSHAGHGQVVALVGEPGVGKSRLVWEFTHSHRAQGWLVLESGSVSYGTATPYLPVVDLLRAYFQVEASDDGRKIREKLTGKLLTLDRTLESTIPALLALLDVPAEDRQWQALDPMRRRQHTLDAVKRLFLRESQAQPLLLVFEDLHWIDSESQAFLDGLVESLPAARLLLLVNYRPEYRHGWGNKTYYSQLRLDPLVPETAGELLQALAGDDGTLAPLKRFLIDRTEGNPFFLEESVRTLIEMEALVGERGDYRLAEPLDDVLVPATVEAVLAARIDRLPGEDKRLLQVAAVIGKDVPFALLRAIAELPDGELQQGLAHLQAAEFLYESSLFPELEYTFKHALTHDVAYRGLLQDRRRALHARCVAILEQVGADRVGEQVDRLAHHAFRAEAWDKAVAYLRQAGTRAIERSAYREAGACFEQALTALEHLPESRSRLEQAVDLRFDLRNVYLVGESRPPLERLREAEQIATVLDDRRRLGWVSVHLARECNLAGEHDRVIERASRALAIAADLGDRRLHAAASYHMGVAHYALGDYPRAAEILRGTIACLEGDLARERLGLSIFPSVLARTMLGCTLGERGEFAEGIAHGEEAVRMAEAVDHLLSLGIACGWLGSVYLDKGDVQKSIPYLERSVHLGQVGSFPFIVRATSALGCAYAMSGRIADALPLLDQCASRDLSETRTYSVPRVYLRTGEAYLVAGRLNEATQMALRARDLAQQRRERGCLAEALRLLGEIPMYRDPLEVESAEVHYRQALVAAEELGMRPLQAHCHLGLGKLYRGCGGHAKAKEHLTTAVTLYRELDMGFWVEKAEAELDPVHWNSN
jgi:tetratricopeptide (TPR) repeat protein